MKKSVTINLYSINDMVAHTFSQPVSFSCDDVAKRSFGDLMSTPQYEKHKADYRIFHIGTFDVDNGVISALKNPVLVANGNEFCFGGDSIG